MRKLSLLVLFLLTFFTLSAQDSIDVKKQLAEKMFQYALHNQGDSLYANMSDQVKSMVQPQQFADIFQQLETQVGKYKSHGNWEEQDIMGQKCYVSTVSFEQSELGVLIVFDENNKMLGIQFLPLEAIKKD